MIQQILVFVVVIYGNVYNISGADYNQRQNQKKKKSGRGLGEVLICCNVKYFFGPKLKAICVVQTS